MTIQVGSDPAGSSQAGPQGGGASRSVKGARSAIGWGELGLALAGTAAIAASAFSLWMNFLFAQSFQGPADTRALLVAASVTADLFKCVLPFLFIGLWRFSAVLAFAAMALWLGCVVWSILSAIGAALEVWSLPLAPRFEGDLAPWATLLLGGVIELAAALGLALVASAVARRGVQRVLYVRMDRRPTAMRRPPAALGPESRVRAEAGAPAARSVAPAAKTAPVDSTPLQNWETLVRHAQQQADRHWAEREAKKNAEAQRVSGSVGSLHHGSATRARLADRLQRAPRRSERKDSA